MTPISSNDLATRVANFVRKREIAAMGTAEGGGEQENRCSPPCRICPDLSEDRAMIGVVACQW